MQSFLNRVHAQMDDLDEAKHKAMCHHLVVLTGAAFRAEKLLSAHVGKQAAAVPALPSRAAEIELECHLHTTHSLEAAQYRASAIIDLLVSKLGEQERAGRLSHTPASWVCDISNLAYHAKAELEEKAAAHFKEIARRLRPAG